MCKLISKELKGNSIKNEIKRNLNLRNMYSKQNEISISTTPVSIYISVYVMYVLKMK